jgi:hypothetical protein
MTHVGQEFAFRAVGRLGCIACQGEAQYAVVGAARRNVAVDVVQVFGDAFAQPGGGVCMRVAVLRLAAADRSAGEIDELRRREMRAQRDRIQRAPYGVVVADHRAVTHGLRCDFDHHRRRLLGIFDVLGELVAVEEHDAGAYESEPGGRIEQIHPGNQGLRQKAAGQLHEAEQGSRPVSAAKQARSGRTCGSCRTRCHPKR